MNSQKKTSVIIAGGGTAGWLTAYTLINRLGSVLDITLIESDQIGTVGVGEATIPTMCNFHRLVGIDEQEFMRATQATFKLGIQFDNWGQIDESYIHSFGELGKRSWMVEFHEFWMEAVNQGFGGSLDDYCLELKAARAKKFAKKVGNQTLNYAYHLNATAYARFLRQKSESAGVRRIEGKITHIDTDEDGAISELEINQNTRFSADLFIDCTGFKGLLIGDGLGVDYEDWSHWLAADSAVAVQTESVSPPVPYTKAIAQHAGWQWQIPLQGRVGNGLVYSSRFLTDDQATKLLTEHLPGEPINQVRQLRFQTGRRVKAWHKNCVAIGLSSGFLEPLESTSIHLITTALVRLMKLFPFNSNTTQQAKRYNDETQLELETVRDFIVLHYKLTRRDDSPFWRHYKNMPIPDSLAHRMEVFRQNGYAWPDDVSLFRVDSWVQVMMGQGLMPNEHHGASRVVSTDDLRRQMTTLSQQIEKTVSMLPSHDDFIARYCVIEDGA